MIEVDDKDKEKNLNRPIPAVSLGLNMVAGMIVFTAIGYWVDQKLPGDSSAATLTGMFMGLIYCGYEVWKLIRNMNNQNGTDTKNP